MPEDKPTPKQAASEAAEQRKVLVRRASSDVHTVVGNMLGLDLTWTEIAAVLEAAAASAKQQQTLEQ